MKTILYYFIFSWLPPWHVEVPPPGTEPVSSWILVRFITIEPPRNSPQPYFPRTNTYIADFTAGSYLHTILSNRIYFFFFFCLFAFSWAAPTAHGGSQARGLIGTVATATQDLSRISSQQCRIPNPLSKARDQTCIIMDTGRICFHCTTTGIPIIEF